MSPLSLDDDLQNKLLAYVTEHKASPCCRAWKDYLYDSLQLQHQIRFKQRLAQGQISFIYSAVRPLAEDFEESVSYNFEFHPDGTYQMQWARTWDAWSSQSEQQYGRYTIFKDSVFCETLEPNRAVGDNEVRFAPPGYSYSVAVDDILESEGLYFQEKLGSPPKPWETAARTGKADDKPRAMLQGLWETPEVAPGPTAPFHAPVRPDARFVEIDDELHEVSGDIVASWPEHEWERLMRCRLRFGING